MLSGSGDGNIFPAASKLYCTGKLLSGGDVGQKTKVAATTGMRKVKEGMSQGFQWIKDKCQHGGVKKQQGSEAPRYY
uniref:Uncharacterized protein n=1 Tax=Zea mays TaxID=4577 RepID=A0A804M8R4_MAIZE